MHLSYNTRDIDRPPEKKNTRGQLIILWNPDGAIHHTHIRTSFDSRNEAFKSNCLLRPLRLQSQSQSTGGQFMGGWHRCRATETRTQLPLSSPLISLAQNQRMRLPLGTIGGWCFRKGLTSQPNPLQPIPTHSKPNQTKQPISSCWHHSTSCGAEFACWSAEINCILLIFLQAKCELVKWRELVSILAPERSHTRLSDCFTARIRWISVEWLQVGDARLVDWSTGDIATSGGVYLHNFFQLISAAAGDRPKTPQKLHISAAN